MRNRNKRNAFKKIMALLLTVCMLIPQTGMAAFAEEISGDESTVAIEETAPGVSAESEDKENIAADDAKQDEAVKADESDSDAEEMQQSESKAEEEKSDAEEVKQSEAQSDENAEEPSEEEIKMPAQTMKAETDEMEVRASWDENIFPEDVTMVVRAANAEQVKAATESLLGDDAKVVDAIAVDITFYSFEDGKHEVQPKDPSGVHVSLNAKRAIKGEQHQVVHIDKNGDAETVADATETGASFDSVGFSVYAVVGTDGKSADEEEVRRTYIFYMPANNDPSYDHTTQAKEWDRQIVKNGDVLVEPGTPSLSDMPDTYFAGWYEEGSDTRMSFGGKVNDIPTAMGSQDQEVRVYAKYVDRYVAYFFDTEDDVEHEVVGAAGDSISMDKDIAGLEEQGMRLLGWSTQKGSTEAEYALTDSFTFTDDDVNFYPIL